MTSSPTTIRTLIDDYIEVKRNSRGTATARAYLNGMNKFIIALLDHKIDAETAPPTVITEDGMAWLLHATRSLAARTEALYMAALNGLYEYMASEGYPINLARVRAIAKQRARRIPNKLPVFPHEDLDKIITYIDSISRPELHETQNEYLAALRDKALILTLADTGLRIFEATGLDRNSIDFGQMNCIITGKGNKQAIVRFSSRAVAAIQEYLTQRAALIPAKRAQGKSAQPIFCRHDRGANTRVLQRITTTTGRNIVNTRALEAGVAEHLHPHLFRHRFVTKVLQKTGNLKIAQELARHENIAITQRYAHLTSGELDSAYAAAIEE